MKHFTNFAKTAAPLLALLTALSFIACDIGSGSDSAIESSYHYASAMTQTQTASASGGAITVANTTKKLVVTGASGKTIYMARTNPLTKALSAQNTRVAGATSGISASAAMASASLGESLEISLGQEAAQDPHAAIYNNFLNGLKNASPAKSVSAAQSAPQDYSVGDTETFWALDPSDLKTYNKTSFKLIVRDSSNKYNIWVKADDSYYTKDSSGFVASAQTLGKKFINGYNVVSHIYGEPTEYLYMQVLTKLQKYKALSEYSKTGDYINIMLYEMLEKGSVYGFVWQGDNILGYDGSNEGRFLYMDSKTLIEEPTEAYSTALHEFSHAISFNVKTLELGVSWTYWYGEMLAMMCEDMMQGYLGISDTETDGNLGHTPKARLSTGNYMAWAQGLTGSESLTYAAAFQLGAWLSRNFGGVKYIKEVARNSSVDFDSILAAIQAAAGKTYTKESLLQAMAGDMLVHASGSGFDKDAAAYPSDSAYTCQYTDDDGNSQSYAYPITAINLWDSFYGWCDTQKQASYAVNQRISFSSLPDGNVYKKADWSKSGGAPSYAYLGPILLNDPKIYANIGPAGTLLFKVGTASSDSVELTFSCVGGFAFADNVTVWVK